MTIGLDDLMYLAFGVIYLLMIRYWLIKIYKRIKQIAHIFEKYYVSDFKER